MEDIMYNIDKDEFIKLVNEKYSVKQLAEYFNCKISTIEDRKRKSDFLP